MVEEPQFTRKNRPQFTTFQSYNIEIFWVEVKGFQISTFFFQKKIHCFSQVIVCSATLHSFDVKKLSERIMHFPTWVDLKGEDSVPETVHHVVVPVNPKSDRLWERLGKNHIRVRFAC